MTALDTFGARRRQLLTGSGAIALGGLLGTPALWAQTGAVTYEPERGQSGKDVIWIPTPDTLVNRMLRMAQVTPKDYVIDLGPGAGQHGGHLHFQRLPHRRPRAPHLQGDLPHRPLPGFGDTGRGREYLPPGGPRAWRHR